MSLPRRLIPILVLPLAFACGSSPDDRGNPMFSNGEASTNSEGGTFDESGGDMSTGDGDGDPATTGDGDGDPTGDGDGDGDGDPTGDGDGDGDPTTGDGDGDCATDPAQVGSSCGQGSAYHGEFPVGMISADMPIGMILEADNGQGNGAEDWYQVDFPLVANTRPMAGTAMIDFAVNDDNDYRFEVYRDCGAQAYGQGLAAEFGASAPPLSEWTFSDLNPNIEQLMYEDTINWPSTVWIRVFRFKNAQVCSNYQLQVQRQ